MGFGAVTATFNEIENADVVIVFGANPIENHPVASTNRQVQMGRPAVSPPGGAREDRTVSPDMEFLSFAYVEGAANILTNPAVDPREKNGVQVFRREGGKRRRASGGRIGSLSR